MTPVNLVVWNTTHSWSHDKGYPNPTPGSDLLLKWHFVLEKEAEEGMNHVSGRGGGITTEAAYGAKEEVCRSGSPQAEGTGQPASPPPSFSEGKCAHQQEF